MSYRSSSIPSVVPPLSSEASQFTADDKLLREALKVLKEHQIDFDFLHLAKNDCLWSTFTHPPFELSLRAVYLLRRKFSYHEAEEGAVTEATVTTSTTATKQRKKRKTTAPSIMSPAPTTISSAPTAATANISVTNKKPMLESATLPTHHIAAASTTTGIQSTSTASAATPGLQQNKLQRFLKKVESSQLQTTDIPHHHAADVSFEQQVQELKVLFTSSDYFDIKEDLEREGFEEILMDEGIEKEVEGETCMHYVQVSCPSHVYNYGLRALASRGDEPYHLGFGDLRTALSSVWETDVLCDDNRDAIVKFLYKTFVTKEPLY